MKTTKLKAIDGTGSKVAPRPTRGLLRAVYDTIDACGGADFKTVRKYLPAAIEDISQVVSKKKIERCLYNAVYRGYLIHDSDHEVWKIAPVSYYVARQEHLAEIEAHVVRAGKYKDRGHELKVIPRQPLTFSQVHLLLAAVGGAFLVGLLCGMAFRFVGF